MDMEQLPYILLEIGLQAILVAFIIATIASVVLFIKDGIKAKKENRKRNVHVKAFFIVMMSFAGAFLAFVLLVLYIAATGMVGM
ncbi:MAG: hypothetical protein K6A37_06415 [Saccharofermentans sp.]|nr:hypothetical protein [Saccharofermentans sp.]